MGFDHERQIFTPDVYKSWAEHLIPTIGEMQMWEVGFINAADVGCDADGNHWLHRYGNVYRAEDVLEVGVEDEDMEFARLICTEVGFIVDYSHRDQISWNAVDEKHDKRAAPFIARNPQDFLPVIFSIYNEEQLEYYGEVLRNFYNIELDGTDLGEVLDVLDTLQEQRMIEIDLDSDTDSDDEE